jgi:hypothetical protein
MTVITRGVGMLVTVALCLAACGGKSASSSGPVQVAPSATSEAAGTWAWADEETDRPSGVPADAPKAAGTPNGVNLGSSTDSGSTATASKKGTKSIDSCQLVTAEQWSTWSGASAPSPTTLEYGQACGWRNDDDSVRMAVGAFEADPGVRWLASQGAPAGQPVAGVDDRARWVTHWPVDQASTLVVEHEGWDVVVEMDSRGGRSDAELRAGATEFAKEAIARLPKA